MLSGRETGGGSGGSYMFPSLRGQPAWELVWTVALAYHQLDGCHTGQTWSEQNSMTLNAEKTEILNVFLNYRNRYDDDVHVNDECITPTDCVKF